MASDIVKILEERCKATDVDEAIHIYTVDNPGWCVSINLAHMELKDHQFKDISVKRTKWDWWDCFLSKKTLKMAGSVYHLKTLLACFNKWLSVSNCCSDFTANFLSIYEWQLQGCKEEDVVDWLMGWYAQYCNGDWEHSYGINIKSTSVPGWSVRISLEGTMCENNPLSALEESRGSHDWYRCYLDKAEFHAEGGPQNLEEILLHFKNWALNWDYRRLDQTDPQVTACVHLLTRSLTLNVPSFQCPICRIWWQLWVGKQPMAFCSSCGAKLHNDRDIFETPREKISKVRKLIMEGQSESLAGTDITEHIHQFRKFLVTSWPSVIPLIAVSPHNDGKHSISDWQQASWEALVEKPLLGRYQFLCSFGLESAHHRISLPGMKPDYKVVIRPIDEEDRVDRADGKRKIPFTRALRLRHFVTFNERDEVRTTPPFDWICVADDQASRADWRYFITEFERVKFYIEQVSPEDKFNL
jgi:hypothetical protein